MAAPNMAATVGREPPRPGIPDIAVLKPDGEGSMLSCIKAMVLADMSLARAPPRLLDEETRRQQANEILSVLRKEFTTCLRAPSSLQLRDSPMVNRDLGYFSRLLALGLSTTEPYVHTRSIQQYVDAGEDLTLLGYDLNLNSARCVVDPLKLQYLATLFRKDVVVWSLPPTGDFLFVETYQPCPRGERDASGWEPLFGQSELPLFVQSQQSGFYGAEGAGLCLRPLQEAITLACLEVGGPYRVVVPADCPGTKDLLDSRARETLMGKEPWESVGRRRRTSKSSAGVSGQQGTAASQTPAKRAREPDSAGSTPASSPEQEQHGAHQGQKKTSSSNTAASKRPNLQQQVLSGSNPPDMRQQKAGSGSRFEPLGGETK